MKTKAEEPKVEMKETLETVIDKLVSYVQENGSVSVTMASKMLAMDPSEVEKLAEILAASGLIEVKYA